MNPLPPRPTAAPDDQIVGLVNPALKKARIASPFGKRTADHSDYRPIKLSLSNDLRSKMRAEDAKDIRHAHQQGWLVGRDTYGWAVEYINPDTGIVTSGRPFRYRDMALDWMQEKQRRIPQGLSRTRTIFDRPDAGFGGMADPLAVGMAGRMMADVSDNPPAFPVVARADVFSTGMTLRDWFAGQALAGLLEGCQGDEEGCFDVVGISIDAYRLADELLATRTPKPEGEA